MFEITGKVTTAVCYATVAEGRRSEIQAALKELFRSFEERPAAVPEAKSPASWAGPQEDAEATACHSFSTVSAPSPPAPDSP